MAEEKDIIKLLEEKESQARCRLRRAVIISPGAVGDCLLMLPLAEFMKKSLDLGGIDFIGHTEYIDFYPARSCIDGIRSLDSIDFHRLFTDAADFKIEDSDSLIHAFSGYQLIVSFLGANNSNFEDNLVFTVNCSHSAEIIILPFKPEPDFCGHISRFYIEKFIASNPLYPQKAAFDPNDTLIHPIPTDFDAGRELLKSAGIDPDGPVVLIHPGSGTERKCWHLDNFRQIAKALKKKGVQVGFILGPAELERFSASHIHSIKTVAKCICNLHLHQVMQILACTKLFLGNDSGITQLSGALGIRTLTVFGPTNPVIYRPTGPAVEVFAADPDSFDNPSAATQDKALQQICEWLYKKRPF